MFFQLGFSTLAPQLAEAAEWTCKSFWEAVWDEKRVKSAAKNLKGRTGEYERDGGEVVAGVLKRLVCVERKEGTWDERCGGAGSANEGAVGTLAQRRFLERVGKLDKEEIEGLFEELREGLGEGSGFVVVTSPSAEQGEKALDTVLGIWDKFAGKSKTQTKVAVGSKEPLPFPITQDQFHPSRIDPSLPRSLVIPISGLKTSHLAMLVPCSTPPGHPDHLPLLLLCSLVSRAEGPLYTRIRGGGWAYGAEISLAAQTGSLRFDVWECSDVRRAVLGMWDVVEGLRTKGWDAGEVETARAMVAYSMVEARGTSGNALWAAICGAAKGFASVEEELAYEAKLFDVTDADLKRVYLRYMRQLLDPELWVGRVSVW
jgi:Zn-dependent M16 (insulinase) family peptidase